VTLILRSEQFRSYCVRCMVQRPGPMTRARSASLNVADEARRLAWVAARTSRPSLGLLPPIRARDGELDVAHLIEHRLND